jgi:hypothetical protein
MPHNRLREDDNVAPIVSTFLYLQHGDFTNRESAALMIAFYRAPLSFPISKHHTSLHLIDLNARKQKNEGSKKNERRIFFSKYTFLKVV